MADYPSQVAFARPPHNPSEDPLPRFAPHSVLITRPQPQADRLAFALHKQGVEVVVSPLMQPVFLPVVVPEGKFEAVILTSEAGAMSAFALLDKIPKRALCVGERTAEVARASGLEAEVFGATAEEMLARLDLESGPFLYLRGREASVDVVAALRRRGKVAEGLVTYAQEKAPMSNEATDLLKSAILVTVPLYSARSTKLFFAACPNHIKADLQLILIAAPLLQAVPEPYRDNAVIAATPDGPAMEAAILRALRPLAP